MTAGLRILLHCFAGLALGVCVVFLAVAAALVTSFNTDGDVVIPGVIRIWRATENGATALNFVPYPLGMGVAALGVAGVYVLIAVLAGGRARRAAASRSEAPG
ncbi:hypothetical protein [uncultured Microbacterium sp.]|uniref:hypothetical protein n=1 Tax=uncultured Microbacterium sp. TaxID=191216 RepID=UPI0025CC7BD9|nr:hypothetical protein [uncultured Microbacterium sp.]